MVYWGPAARAGKPQHTCILLCIHTVIHTGGYTHRMMSYRSEKRNSAQQKSWKVKKEEKCGKSSLCVLLVACLCSVLFFGISLPPIGKKYYLLNCITSASNLWDHTLNAVWLATEHFIMYTCTYLLFPFHRASMKWQWQNSLCFTVWMLFWNVKELKPN